VLVDCNLPRGHVREEFFRFVSSLGIERLDLVCLTHPHDDHYTGMADVLRYFSSSGRSVGVFCDGVEPKEIQTLLRRRFRPQSSIQEYERLYQYVDQLVDSGRVKYFRADANSTPIIASENGHEMELMPVGPRPEIARQAVRQLVSSGKIRADLNRLSIVLALVVRFPEGGFDALLAADTDAEGFLAALSCLQGRIKAPASPRFDVVKVAHHGSLDSHQGSTVCKCHKIEGECVAAISTGHFDVLPDREVLQDFLDNDWTVILTTKRLKPLPSYALELSGRSARDNIAVQPRNLKIEWSENEGLAWYPPESRVDTAEMTNYQTIRN
jgi:beta-lactamase superfamily II metal-dependent hydrolase